jgi:beta-galactosidase
LDITRAVTFGKPMRLRVYVVSTADEGEVKELMGIIPGQNTTRKAERESGGLIGAVTLQTRPKTARIEDVFVQTSTRKKELRLELSLGGLATPEAVEVTAQAVNAKGIVEKTFAPVTLTPSATPGETGRSVAATWQWENPRLWDLEQPNLYTLQITVKGAGIEDAVSQPFGFREFWVKGRDLYLNGTPFRMRPTLVNADAPGGWEERSAFGFNIAELWPGGHERRTQESRYVAWYEYADTRGIPITGILPHMDWMGNSYSTPERAAAFEAQVRRDLRRYRNHPSVVMWGTSGNMMGATGNPKFAGLRDASRTYDMARSENLRGAFPLAQRGVDYMKSQDPTRPVFIHFGGAIGDLYTLNHYLIFTPLQEREEFVSHWAKYGDMPLWYVEFGTPLNTSLMRGRNGFGNAMKTEPFLSEYCAIYQGVEAYRREPDAYRADIAAKFVGGQEYQGWFFYDPINLSASFQELQKLFLTNTWRSYRTYGLTGGMIPWDGGYISRYEKRTPAGEAFAVANAPTLAWIAGDKPAFTAKDHHYRTGQTLRKQIALLNDSRAPQSFAATWTARLGDGTVLGKDERPES